MNSDSKCEQGRVLREPRGRLTLNTPRSQDINMDTRLSRAEDTSGNTGEQMLHLKHFAS